MEQQLQLRDAIRVYREALQRVVVVGIEARDAAARAARCRRSHEHLALLADEPALEHELHLGHVDRLLKVQRHPLRRALVRVPARVLLAVEHELLAILLGGAIQDRAHSGLMVSSTIGDGSGSGD